METTELYNQISSSSNLSKKEFDQILDSFIKELIDNLIESKKIVTNPFSIYCLTNKLGLIYFEKTDKQTVLKELIAYLLPTKIFDIPYYPLKINARGVKINARGVVMTARGVVMTARGIKPYNDVTTHNKLSVGNTDIKYVK